MLFEGRTVESLTTGQQGYTTSDPENYYVDGAIDTTGIMVQWENQRGSSFEDVLDLIVID